MLSVEAGNAALRSVGTTVTLASAGYYLHARGFISESATKAFGYYIQQIGLPLYFFTKLIECPPQSAADSELTTKHVCPSVLDHWHDAWILLVWPLYVIACGLLVGYTMARITNTPQRHYRTAMLSTAFANSISVPTTLLTVLYQHAMKKNPTAVGGEPMMDPNTYLSVYLILYPMLNWSFGYWLAVPAKAKESGGSSVSNEDINEEVVDTEETGLLEKKMNGIPPTSRLSGLGDAVSGVLSHACQPPVIGSLLGLIVTAIDPIRALMVGSNAPLDWWFDGLSLIGTSSIPVYMAVLGMHLSTSVQSRTASAGEKGFDTFHWKTNVGIILGKLVIMPIIGFVSYALLRHVTSMSIIGGTDDNTSTLSLSPSLSLVLMIVWITPTANNVVVIADLAGGMREAVAQLLVWQYLIVPFALSLSVAVVVHMSSFTV